MSELYSLVMSCRPTRIGRVERMEQERIPRKSTKEQVLGREEHEQGNDQEGCRIVTGCINCDASQ